MSEKNKDESSPPPAPAEPEADAALTEEELIDQALAQFGQEPPAEEPEQPETESEPGPETEGQEQPTETPPPAEASETLAGLEGSRRKSIETVCTGCPNALWFVSDKEVQCYCRVMFLVVWSSKEKHHFTACDGTNLGQPG